MSRRKPALAVGALALLLTMFPCMGDAADYTVTPTVSSKLNADTNRRLFIRDPAGSLAAIFEFATEIEARAPDYVWTAKPRVLLQQFTNERNPDREQLILDFTGQRTWERFAGFIAGDVARRSAIDSELTQTGSEFENVNRHEFSIGPGVTYQLSPQLSVSASGYWQDVAFEENTAGLLDFRFWSTSITAEYQYSTKSQVNSRFIFSQFESPEAGGTTDTYTIWLGWSSDLSDTLSADLQAGVNFSELTFQEFVLVEIPGLGTVVQTVPDSTNELGYVLDARISKDFNLARLDLLYHRRLSPSSRGAQSVSDEYELTFSKEVTDHLEARAAVRYLDRQSEGQEINALDVTLLRSELSLVWRTSRHTRITSAYEFRRRNLLGGTGESHRLNIKLSYQFEPFRF